MFDLSFLDMMGKPLLRGGTAYPARVWTDQLWDEAVCYPHRVNAAGLLPVNHRYHHPTRQDYRPFSRKLQNQALELIVTTGVGLKPYRAKLGVDELRSIFARRALWAMLNKTHDIYRVIDYLERKGKERG